MSKNADFGIHGANLGLMRQVARTLRMGVLGGPVAEAVLDQVLQHFIPIPYQPDSPFMWTGPGVSGTPV